MRSHAESSVDVLERSEPAAVTRARPGSCPTTGCAQVSSSPVGSLQVSTERVDDIPVLLAQCARMGLAALLNKHFPSHGNWRGTDRGSVTCVWLSHILSQGDHCLNHVQPWVAQRQECISLSLGQSVRELDFSDDRLACILRQLGDDVKWEAFEAELQGRLIQVFQLRPEPLGHSERDAEPATPSEPADPVECIRLDSTTASGYRGVTENGLFQYGYSKDGRKELPIVKVMQAILDPFGLPLLTQVLPGNAADDPLYLPAIQQLQERLRCSGMLFVGDCKMAALTTRAAIHHAGDYYLCPLPISQTSEAEIDAALAGLLDDSQILTPLYRHPGEVVLKKRPYTHPQRSEQVQSEQTQTDDGLVAQAFEREQTLRLIQTPKSEYKPAPPPPVCRPASKPAIAKALSRQILGPLQADPALERPAQEEDHPPAEEHPDASSQELIFQERHIWVRSEQRLAAQQEALERKVRTVSTQLEVLQKRLLGNQPLRSVPEVQSKVEALLQKYGCNAFFRIRYLECSDTRPARRSRRQPDTEVSQNRATFEVEFDEHAFHRHQKRLGWRRFVTNTPVKLLPLPLVVSTYRGQPHIERGFSRLKGSPLSLCPMYLSKDEHIKGLLRLLSIALRILTLTDHACRRSLRQESVLTDREVAGLYAGNPARKTSHPTAELVLRAFRGITCTTISTPTETIKHLPELTPIQQKLLSLLDLSPSIYHGLLLPSTLPVSSTLPDASEDNLRGPP